MRYGLTVPNFGEEPDLRVRGAMLDEALDLLTRFWSGEPVLHHGAHYRFRGDFGPGRAPAEAIAADSHLGGRHVAGTW